VVIKKEVYDWESADKDLIMAAKKLAAVMVSLIDMVR